MIQKKIFFSGVFLITTLLSLLLFLPSATAENSMVLLDDPLEEHTDCAPLDIIFLIDQSDSMTTGGNDPAESRKYAVQTALDFMGDIVLDSCPGVQHRVAVVSFGTDAQIDLPLSGIGPYISTGQSGEAFNRRDELKRGILATNLGQTDPLDAFVLADKIFNEAGTAVGDDENTTRKRAIVFITDGVPDVNSDLTDCDISTADTYARCLQDYIDAEFQFDNTLLSLEQCLDGLRAELDDPNDPLPAEERATCFQENRVSPAAYDNSTYIWMLLMRDSDRIYPGLVKEIFEEISSTHAGQLINLSNNRSEVPSAFRDIMQQLTGVRAERIECGNFAVNPYLKQAKLSFFKFEPENLVQISYEDINGTEYVLENAQSNPLDGFEVNDYTVAGANERYLLGYPYPGVWNLTSDDCEGLIAEYTQIDITLSTDGIPSVLPQFEQAPYFNTHSDKHFLKFQLVDSENNRIVEMAEHPQFEIVVTASVEGPGGYSEVFDFTYYPHEDIVTRSVEGADGRDYKIDVQVEKAHTFVADQPITTKDIGDYSIELLGTSFRHEGEVSRVSEDLAAVFDQKYVVVDEKHTLNVKPVTLFDFNLESPVDGEIFKPIHSSAAPGDTPPEIAPLPIRIQLVDITDQSSLAGEISNIFAESDLGKIFKATIQDPQGGLHEVMLSQDAVKPDVFIGEIAGLGDPGEYNLTLEVVGAVDENNYFPETFIKNIIFEREDETWRFVILEPEDEAEVQPIHDRIWDDGLHWPLRLIPLPLRVQLVDESGNSYDNIEEVVEYAPQELKATVESGEESVAVSLGLDPQNPGEYIGTVENLATSGEHELEVALDISYDSFQPQSEAAYSQFNRSDTILTTPLTYLIILGLIILLIVLLILRYRSLRNNPIRGELYFLEQGSEIGAISLYNGKNKREIKHKELDVYPMLELKKITASSLSKQKAVSDSSEQFGDFGDSGGFGSGGGSGIKIDYVTEGGHRERGVILEPNLDIPCGDTIFTMQYRPLNESGSE